jgi:hypothetical protein
MKNKGSRMARNRSRIPLKRVDADNQVEDSGVIKKRAITIGPLENRACCCSIGR